MIFWRKWLWRLQPTLSRMGRKYHFGRYSFGRPIIHGLKGNHPNLPVEFDVGNFCSIGSNVQVFLDVSHQTQWVTCFPFECWPELTMPDRYKGKGAVRIGHDIWIANNVTILSGVNIGHGAVIATGSIVTKDVPAYAMVAGNPARVIRYRFDAETIARLLELEWWYWPISEIKKKLPLLMAPPVDHAKWLEPLPGLCCYCDADSTRVDLGPGRSVHAQALKMQHHRDHPDGHRMKCQKCGSIFYLEKL